MKITRMTTHRVYGFRLFGRFIKLWTGKDILNKETYGWDVPSKLKDCPICWGGKFLFFPYTNETKTCYFCRGLGSVSIDDKRNPYLAEDNLPTYP